jgi:hypothetical protein
VRLDHIAHEVRERLDDGRLVVGKIIGIGARRRHRRKLIVSGTAIVVVERRQADRLDTSTLELGFSFVRVGLDRQRLGARVRDLLGVRLHDRFEAALRLRETSLRELGDWRRAARRPIVVLILDSFALQRSSAAERRPMLRCRLGTVGLRSNPRS